MKYEDELVFDEGDVPETLSKKYLLSRMNFLEDIGYRHNRQVITKDCIMNFVFITSLNRVSLNIPLKFYEEEKENSLSKFNLREVNDEYGHYFIIRGKFSYSAVVGEQDYGTFIRNGAQVTGANFNIGFINNCAAIIYDGNNFDFRSFISKNNVLAEQKCGNSGIIYIGELDLLDRELI